MAIIATSRDNDGNVTKVEVRFEGRVVKVRTYTASRNHSDTLDYTDFQSTQVTEALVWVGREETRYDGTVEPVAPANRFQWVDCTNLFTWRGSPHMAPKVDFIALAVPELFEDLEVWLRIQEEREAEKARAHAVHEAAQKKAREDDEKNRPVPGKQMVVARGRKVKVGTVGTVAFVSGSGSVLLKADNAWQDRQAPGTWVSATNLRAR
jgi:hypothetical protein